MRISTTAFGLRSIRTDGVSSGRKKVAGSRAVRVRFRFPKPEAARSLAARHARAVLDGAPGEPAEQREVDRADRVVAHREIVEHAVVRLDLDVAIGPREVRLV